MAEIPTTKALRAVTIATLIPAFPLCIVHGALSNRPVPAVGLVPLFFSAGTSLFLLARHAKHQREQTASGRPAGADGGEDGESEPEREQEREQEQERDRDRDREHEGASAPPDDDAKGWPILVFFWDLVLAAALMTVLTFTWLCTRYEGDASLSMLAAYATLPLLVNFLIHLYLAVRALSAGLALQTLMQWLAWQAVPPACPSCNHRLRPARAPHAPWLQRLPSVAAVRARARSSLRIPELKTPAWLRKPGADGQVRYAYAPLLARQDDDEEAEREEARYRDEPSRRGGTGEASGQAETLEPRPLEAVEVVRSKKAKTAPLLQDDGPADWRS